MKDKKEAVQKDALYAKEIDLILHGDEEALQAMDEEQLESFRKAYMVPLPAKKLRRFHKRVRMHRRKQAQSLQEELFPSEEKKNLQFLGMLLCILVTLLAVTVGAFYESLSNFFVEEEDDTTIVQITPAHAGKDFLMFERGIPLLTGQNRPKPIT